MAHDLGRTARRVFVVLLLTILAGCANPLEQFLEREEVSDELEGSLTIYTPMSADQANAYLRLFRGQYPLVDVNLVALSSAGTLDRLLAEKEDPQADVVWGLSATMMNLLEWHDVLQPYGPEGLERVFLQFRDSNIPPYWVGFGAWMSTFCVNNEKLETSGLPKPDSWQSLFDPVYEGQIAMPRPDESGTGYMIVEAVLEIFGEVNGWENLDALHNNVKAYTESSTDACEMAANGEVAIGIAYDIIPINLTASGKPVEAVFAAEGVGWDIEANGLVAKSEIKETARIFLDWAISEETMEIYGESRTLLGIPLEGHRPPPGLPEEPLAVLYDKDFVWASANRARIITEWLARYGEQVNPE